MGLTFGEASELPGPELSSQPLTEPTATPAPTPRRGRPPGSRNQTSTANLEKRLAEKLLEEMVVPLAFISPLAAANVEARAERTAKAAARLAAKNPRVKKGIERIIDGSDVFTVAMFPLSTAICVMVDWGMMPPLAAPARAAGVPHLWDDAHPEEPLDVAIARAEAQQFSTENGGGFRRGLDAEAEQEIHGDGWQEL